MGFIQRLRTVQIDKADWETATKRNYYDRDGVADLFGTDEATRRTQMREETDGRGAMSRQRMRTGDPGAADFYLDGPEVDPDDPSQVAPLEVVEA